MTVDQMIELLQEASERGLGDTNVRIATQPNYPMEVSIQNAAIVDESEDDCECESILDCDCDEPESKPAFWIATSNNESYISNAPWNA